jgi:large subunit ribosomal protein L15
MKLSDLAPAKGSRKNRKRLGRGVGSGQGRTGGRGDKGQNSRSGGGVRAGYEGGQMPIHRRLPKRGFTNIFRKVFSVINVRDLERFESGAVVDENELIRCGLVKGPRDGIKLLAHGEITKGLTVKVNRVSQSAREKIEAAGGSVEVI